MRYRMGRKDDIDQLTQLRIAYLLTDFQTLSDNELTNLHRRLPPYFEKHLNEELFVYLAEEDGTIIATVYLLVVEKPANPYFPTGKVGEVLSVYTKPDYRRKGIAKTLMERLLTDAKEKGVSYVELSATKDGYSLYKGLGFREHESAYEEMRYEIGGER